MPLEQPNPRSDILRCAFDGLLQNLVYAAEMQDTDGVALAAEYLKRMYDAALIDKNYDGGRIEGGTGCGR